MEAGLPAERLTRESAKLKTGIVHLGLGAFFRAHGAIYTAEAAAKSGGDWGITGVSLQSSRMRDALAPQDFAYSGLEFGPEGETPERIEIVSNILVAREDPQAVLDVMADPDVRIVSLTITEKGYCHSPATGALDPDHPDIVHDMANDLPVSAPGYLVRALQLRRTRGLRPFTAMSCDNLPENGRLLRGVVLDLARRIDPELADWIAREGRFPSTMVDRIVPATKPEDIARLEELAGWHDALPVMHEPFRQWVIEDDFVDDERPDWGAVGVEMVSDVTPFEHMKLRMLNGTHSSLAYLGYLAGHETISDTMDDEVMAGFVRHLWRSEIIPSLTPPPGVSLEDYADALAERYANPAIRHRTWQIAMDGSQKLPQRILATVADTLKAGRSCPGLMLAIAAWMRYVGGVDESGQPIEVKDPLAAELRALSDSAADAEGKVAALLSLRSVFPPELAQPLQAPVTEAYRALVEKGARTAVQEVLQ
ncbi:mannitol dehydrogenase [Thioclava sp. F1Mire-8]|uniref:mannitol dehydrogenase family protein n=1 Tax=Thioclava sp. F1Mire-8 TaxID=1973006 RepID=UPI000B54005E|nr:mannitol dehydrogenase family protein [Thioclava sp. F1Mire-8]OWY06229.1 mannitol dehydrogenase [Thioclava sp. F1Mire-8]